MKVLLTGATGLIGQKLTELLLEKGHQVNFLTTSVNKIKDEPHLKGYFWNLKYGKIDDSCFNDVDAIIHLAGASIAKRWTQHYKKEILNSRVASTQLLYKGLNKKTNHIKHIIAASGTAIYPDDDQNIYYEGSTEKATGFLSDVVQKWEENVDVFSKNQIIVSKIRTGVVFAKQGGALPEILKPIKNGLGAHFGDGNQQQSWIHIDDLTQLYYYVLTHHLSGVYHAVAPEVVSNKVQNNTIAQILNKRIWLPNIPKWFMKLILGDMHELLFNNKNISSEKIQKAGFQFRFPTIHAALVDILK
ncbi:TIGR01777 family oxidoreductase [Flavobacterium branchiophilum]|uniref:TIGR01777 family protein n=1 Tax=Flavobacterium branchiophilum TaxID=55197 RepID=A0A2H3K924_9FLAO|nr:TIGR01777 family oxidoreductase [Flavobacterium branchiophilum]PDS22530.1 TIGR01777 family protein [Flavobacterium branchiophilum]